MKKMNNITEEAAPWRIPVNVSNSLEYTPYRQIIHDVCKYRDFKTSKKTEPMPTLINLDNSLYPYKNPENCT